MGKTVIVEADGAKIIIITTTTIIIGTTTNRIKMSITITTMTTTLTTISEDTALAITLDAVVVASIVDEAIALAKAEVATAEDFAMVVEIRATTVAA